MSEKQKDLRCAPDKKFEDDSCIPLDTLVSMANAFNENSKNKIKLHSELETLNPSKYKKYLVKEFTEKLSNVCDNQRCWLRQGFINSMKNHVKADLTKNTFRPKGPEGKFTWLNTININDVMGQYEKKYSDFKFLGAVPIDFDELPVLGIKDLNPIKLFDKGIKKLGIVFNLDEHYKDGSHWVASFINMNKGSIYFYDSYGVEPDKRIRAFLRRMARGAKECGVSNIDIRHNKVRHQFKGSECGVYSINFIHRLLDGDSFDKIISDETHDDDMNQNRNLYFT